MIGLLFVLCLLLALCFAYRVELQREFCWAIGGMNYNPGGLVVPPGYTMPTAPYLPQVGSVNSGYWNFLSGTAADFNGKSFVLRRQEADGSFTSIEFEYHTGAAPAPPVVGINIAGFTLASEIRAATMNQLTANGFYVTGGGGGEMRVSQPNPGTAADVGFLEDFEAEGLLTIGPDSALATDAFSIYGARIFFLGSGAGFELGVPLRIGKLFGFAPVPSAEPNDGGQG